MKKIIAIIALSVSLAGCGVETVMQGVGVVVNGIDAIGTVAIKNPVTRTRLAQVVATYGGYQAAANVYRDLCDQKTIARSTCAPVVLKLQAADRQVMIAIEAAASFIRNNPTLDASSVVSVAISAFTAFKQIADANGVVK